MVSRFSVILLWVYAVCNFETEATTVDGWDCDLWTHHFTVYQGEFQDVCGGITFSGIDYQKNPVDSSILTENVNEDGNFVFRDREFLATNALISLYDDWTIVFKVKNLDTSNTRNMVLGPGGNNGNTQIRFEGANKMGLYSIGVQGAPYLWHSFNLPQTSTDFHEYIIRNTADGMSVYQDGALVTSVSDSVGFIFARVGGWFQNQWADLEVVRYLIAVNDAVTRVEPTISCVKDGRECRWRKEGVCQACRFFFDEVLVNGELECERYNGASQAEIDYACNGRCENDNCKGEDNPNCEDLKGWGCKTCEQGYFRKSNDHLCVPCSLIPNCDNCNADDREWNGCDVCASGYEKTYDFYFGYVRCVEE